MVEAYTALWIEIRVELTAVIDQLVEAYTALWIEIQMRPKIIRTNKSRLIQPCGLKCSYWQPSYKSGVRRGLYSLVD